ncbi:MAG TPA: pilus assembly protein TadG-related protein [Acidimicrobiia bacterium]|nr:pilus assembly protein TadG-related protein [Acidimicrobiia bacterium]
MTVFVVVFVVALTAVAGLVFDGANVLAARQQAANVAASAARAGAEALDVANARTSGDAPLDTAEAVDRASTYLTQTGYTGSASVHGNEVFVEVTITRHLFVLGLAGRTAVTVHGRGAARARRAVQQLGN